MHSKMHPYLNWAKERLDEMDAALASLEVRVGEVQADTRLRASEMLADLREKRNIFQDAISKQAGAGEAAWIDAKVKLDSVWISFEAQVKQYVETFAQQVEQQQATFKRQADAQLKAWRAAAGRLDRDANEFAAERRSEVEATVKRMTADAAAAEEKLRKFSQAGTQSWSAMTAALTETRAAFDRANQATADAFKRAVR
jgi:hypothetical protein